MKDIAILGLVFARLAIEPTAVGDDGLMAIRGTMSFQTPLVATSDVAEGTVEHLGCDIECRSGSNFGLGPPGSCKAVGGVRWSLVGAEFAVIRSPDGPASLKRGSSHVFELFRREIEVIDTVDNAFGERVVRTEALPFQVISSPGTIGREAVVCGGVVHRPEDEMERSLDSNKCSAEGWDLCRARNVARSEQGFVDLFVAVLFCISETAGFHSTTFVLNDAVSNTIVDSAGTRADVDLEASTFTKDQEVDAPRFPW